MHAALLMLAFSSVGVDTGWQPLDDGGFEYIIQIEPQLLDALRRGEEITSDIAPFLRDVRSYRIRVGTAEVPRLGNPRAAQPRVEAEPPIDATRQPIQASETPAETEPAAPPLRDRIPLRNGFESMQPPRYERYQDRTPPAEPAKAAPNDQAINEPTGNTPPPQLPRTFQPDPGSTALVQHNSGYRDDQETGPLSKSNNEPFATKPKAKADPNEVAPESRPWFQLTVALLALFVSLGGNVYLGLQWWSLRCRCQNLMLRQRGIPGKSGSGRRGVANAAEDDVEYEEEDDEEDQEVRAVVDAPQSQRQRRR